VNYPTASIYLFGRDVQGSLLWNPRGFLSVNCGGNRHLV
jgi:hypothetical protein